MAQKKANVGQTQANAVGQSVNKRAEVAALLNADPNIMPEQIVETLKAKGIEINRATASSYKSSLLSSAGQKKMGNGRGRKVNQATVSGQLEVLKEMVRKNGKAEVLKLVELVS